MYCRCLPRIVCVLLCLLSSPFYLSDVSAQGRKKPANAAAESTETAGAETSEGNETKTAAAPSQRAKLIFARAKILAVNVVNVSKGAKGVGMPLANREHWDIIGKSPAFKDVIAQAEQYQKEEIPLPDKDDYDKFYETQKQSSNFEEVNREYEIKYSKRRDRLYKLVLAECIENQGRFLNDIEKIILVICTLEPAWSIPSEDSNAEKYLGKNLSIDRQIARTAWDLATAYYWLGRKLPPETRELLGATVRIRVLSKFEEAILTDNYGLIGWANTDNHNNADSHASVVGAALALIDSAEYRAQYIAAAEYNVEKFLKSFTRDGYFQDGIWAWNEGYGSLILLAEMMYQATDGRIDMFKRPNIKETALYGPRMEITKGVYEIFGDRWRGDRPSTFPTAFVSKRFQMGLKDIEDRAPFFGVGPGHLYQVGVYCFPNSATEQKGQPSDTLTPPLETLRSEFALNGVMVLRSGKKDDSEIGVQLKGGNNNELGNHSDVGTYVIALGGSKPLTDIGARYYRRGITVTDRYESNFINSFGHPVPRIDGKNQINGKETICPLLTREFTDKKDTLKYDLQYVYGWENAKDVKEFTRTFVYDRTGADADGHATFTVTDYFRVKIAKKYENCLITFGPFKKLTEDENASSIDLIIGEGKNAIHVNVSNVVTEIDTEAKKFAKKPKPLVFEAGLLKEPTAGNRDNRTPFRLGFGFESPVDEVQMTVKIRPANDSERNLAKNSPGKEDRTYESPIDTVVEEKVAVADESGDSEDTNPMAVYDKYDKYDKYVKLLKITLGEEKIEEFKQMPNDKAKEMFLLLKKGGKAGNLPDIPEDQIDAVIDYLKERL